MGLRIIPLHLGDLTVDKAGLTLRTGVGTKKRIPCLAYLILGRGAPILVDSGPSEDPAWGSAKHNLFERTADQSLENQCAKAGVALDEIKLVIITHLHWDHCYGNSKVRNARILVQRRELEYSVTPCQCDRPIYESDANPLFFLSEYGRMDFIDGDAQVADGIRVLALPGHTPGLQGVAVELESETCTIVSDHCPLFENFEAHIPTGLLHSMEDWYRSTEKLRRLGGSILPGHDPKVLEKLEYR